MSLRNLLPIKLPIALPRCIPPTIPSIGLRSICSFLSLPRASRSCFTTSTDNPVVLEKSSILSIMELIVEDETLLRSSNIVTQSELSLNCSNCNFAVVSLWLFSAPSLTLCFIWGSSIFSMSSSCLSYFLFSSSICCAMVAFFSMMSVRRAIVSDFIFLSSSSSCFLMS